MVEKGSYRRSRGPSYPLERPWLALLVPNDPARSRLNCACGLVVKT